MSSNKHEHKTAIFEDGTHAVLRFDPANPRFIEVIATFYEAAHARDYVSLQSSPSQEHPQEKPRIIKQAAKGKAKQALAANPAQASNAKPKQPSAASPRKASETKPKRAAETHPQPAPDAKSKDAATGVTERQTAVLKALRSLMDKKHRVEVSRAVLAEASSVPLGSLHSTLASLEKKHMIRTERQGTPKLSPIYEVLETSQKSTRSLNGVVHAKSADAQAAG